MACKVITQFRTKPGHADDLLGLLKKYVPESAHHAGCLEICIQQNQDDPNDIISKQYWETRKHYNDYFAWRGDQGVDAELQSQLNFGQARAPAVHQKLEEKSFGTCPRSWRNFESRKCAAPAHSADWEFAQTRIVSLSSSAAYIIFHK